MYQVVSVVKTTSYQSCEISFYVERDGIWKLRLGTPHHGNSVLWWQWHSSVGQCTLFHCISCTGMTSETWKNHCCLKLRNPSDFICIVFFMEFVGPTSLLCRISTVYLAAVKEPTFNILAPAYRVNHLKFSRVSPAYKEQTLYLAGGHKGLDHQ